MLHPLLHPVSYVCICMVSRRWRGRSGLLAVAGTVPAGLHLYIAPIGLGDLNGAKFYGGIQTNIGGDPVCGSGSGNGSGSGSGGGSTGVGKATAGDAAEDPHHRSVEEQSAYHSGCHGAIFSRWSTRNTPVVDLSFVRAAADGRVESAGYEGDFVSGRRPYSWGIGEYTYSIRKTAYEQDADGTEWTWCEATVMDKATLQTTFIAALKFPGKTLQFWGKNSAFIEIYGGGKPIGKKELLALPWMQVTFECPRINGADVELDKIIEAHPSKSGPISPKIMSTEMASSGSIDGGGASAGGDDGDVGFGGEGNGSSSRFAVVCTLNGKGVERTADRRELFACSTTPIVV